MSRTVPSLELDLDALSDHLVRAGVPPQAPLTAELISGGRSNLTYRVTDGVHRWILRRPPLGDLLPGAHDMAREYRVISALAASDVPVPPTVLHCADAGVIGCEFYLMDEVDGVVLRTVEQVEAIPVAERARLSTSLVDTLVDLHRTDHREVGLDGLGRPDGYLDRQLARWLRQYRAVEVRPLPQIERIAATLGRAVPDSGRAAIIHGDYRLDNVIVDAAAPHRITAVLDWEMATLGDPLADLATLLMFWDERGRPINPISGGLTACAGFMDRPQVIERYVSAMGFTVDDVDWYLVFAQFRLAVILEQIHVRGLTGHAAAGSHDGVGDMVPPLLDGALEDIARSAQLRDRR